MHPITVTTPFFVEKCHLQTLSQTIEIVAWWTQQSPKISFQWSNDGCNFEEFGCPHMWYSSNYFPTVFTDRDIFVATTKLVVTCRHKFLFGTWQIFVDALKWGRPAPREHFSIVVNHRVLGNCDTCWLYKITSCGSTSYVVKLFIGRVCSRIHWVCG